MVEFIASDGRNTFAMWFRSLDTSAAAKVVVALARLEAENVSSVKSLSAGVMEYRIDWGPGYRIYFGREGAQLIISLAGGTKQRQQRDIDLAKSNWLDY